MSLKKFANWTGDVVGEFTGAAGEERAANKAAKKSFADQQRMQELTGQRANVMQGYQTQIQDMVMGNTPMQSIPGYEAMQGARTEGINDMMTQMGGAGMFFSGDTAKNAANISGSMENDLFQQHLQNLRTGMGGEQDITNLMMGGNQTANQYGSQGSNFKMAGAGARADSMSDMLGAAGTMIGGMGGFGAIGSSLKSGVGGAVDWASGMANQPWNPPSSGYQMTGSVNRGR